MSRFELREYQQDLITNVRKSCMRGHKSVLAILGCGGGKSLIQAEIAKNSTDKGNNVLFLVHRKELCSQIFSTFVRQGVDMDRCMIGMVQTISRRIDKIPVPQLIITDEAHHSIASTYRKIYDAFPKATRLGFTATPERLGGSGLGEVYEDMVTSVSTRWLIDNGYLADYKYYSVKLADTSKLHTQHGDYKSNEVAELMDNAKIYGSTVSEWEKLAKGKKTIVYNASVETANQTAEEFCKAGYKAVSLDGATDKTEREKAVQDFRDGNIDILCNCELFGEGFDVPSCECVVLLRPTKSLSLFIQQSMRSMRYSEGKTAIIIDHVANCYMHGLPDDMREWSLEGKPKKEREKTVKLVKECPDCGMALPISAKICECGHEFKRVLEYEKVDTDLKELTAEDKEKIRIEKLKNTPVYKANLKTWDNLVEFQKAKGYKFGWCLHWAIAHNIAYPSKYEFLVRKIKEGNMEDVPESNAKIVDFPIDFRR